MSGIPGVYGFDGNGVARIVSAVRHVETLAEQVERVIRPMRRGPQQYIEHWVGRIVTAGPDSESDYSDERYWVKEARAANTTGLPDTAVTLEDRPSSDQTHRHVTATNLVEIAAGSHDLVADTPVHVFAIYDQQSEPVKRYWFVGGGSGVALRWAVLTENWSKPADESDGWHRTISANPCDDEDGNGVDTSTTLTLYFPWLSEHEDNLFLGWRPLLQLDKTVPYLPLPGIPNTGVLVSPMWRIDHDRTWFEFASGFTNRDGDTIYKSLLHSEPWADDPNAHEFDVMVDLETRDDMDGWSCGHLRVYRATMKWDSRGHVLDPISFALDEYWADVTTAAYP